MKILNMKKALQKVEALKQVQSVKESITLVIASDEPDGKVRAVIHVGEPTSKKHGVYYFDSMDDLLNQPGMCESTIFIYEELYE